MSNARDNDVDEGPRGGGVTTYPLEPPSPPLCSEYQPEHMLDLTYLQTFHTIPARSDNMYSLSLSMPLSHFLSLSLSNFRKKCRRKLPCCKTKQ